jgi:hypothetical protein
MHPNHLLHFHRLREVSFILILLIQVPLPARHKLGSSRYLAVSLSLPRLSLISAFDDRCRDDPILLHPDTTACSVFTQSFHHKKECF